MISGVDHIIILTPEIEAGVAVYAALLGRAPDWQAVSDKGTATALFRLSNTALELIAPHGEGAGADHLRARVAEEGPGLKSLAFRSTDIVADHKALSRLGLAPTPVEAVTSEATNGAARSWRRFRTPAEQTANVRWFFVEPTGSAPEPADAGPGGVHALDHLVINTPNPDRAMALYGAKLGLRLALDRTAPEWGVRLMFFRSGGLTVEIAHRLAQGEDAAGPDSFWGLTWRVGDIDAANARLAAAGLNVSPVRAGRKPGTRVFTVRDGTLNVPTLFIAGGSD